MDMDMAPMRTQTPDSDTDTPPLNPPTNRAHHGTNTHAPGVYYKECMKNHAASLGGHALDGCCEFMPGPTFKPSDPTSLKCAACGCHRNFHRRDPDDPTPLNHLLTAPTVRRAHSPPAASHLLLSLSHSPSGPSDEINPTAVNPSAGGTSGGGLVVGYGSGGGGQNGNFTGSSSSSKKRFRTKFTQVQKEKMYEFSEKIGWRLKKGEERLVEEFVKGIGVGRSVFKVWMHNNKHNSSRGDKSLDQQHIIKPHLNPPPPITNSLITSTTTSIFGVEEDEQPQQRSTSNGSNNASVGGVAGGNCGASVVADHHHHPHHHHQFNFVSGAEAQAQ